MTIDPATRGFLTAVLTLSGAFVGGLIAIEARRRDDAGDPADRSTDRHRTALALVALLLLATTTASAIALATDNIETWQIPVLCAALLAGLAIGVLSTYWTSYRRTARPMRPAVLWLVVGGLAGFGVALLIRGDDLPRGYRFQIQYVCDADGCDPDDDSIGLRQRSAPNPHAPKVGRVYHDGDRVLVVCQTKGDPARGTASPIWDRLVNGHYVSDGFVDTPGRGRFTEGLPRC
jgi:hypothetical protein